VDRLCDQTRGQNAAVTCFYFDFAARKEQSATNMLGSLLRQVIDRAGGIPEEIRQTLREQKEAAGGRRPQLADIVKMLQLITSSQCTYMCIDALDECIAAQRFRLFDSLKQILEKSPSARIFVTGRHHIRAEIENRLAGRVASVSVGPTRDDIVNFLRDRLSKDETPDAMDASLEAEIMEKIPENISEMCVGKLYREPHPTESTNMYGQVSTRFFKYRGNFAGIDDSSETRTAQRHDTWVRVARGLWCYD